MAIKYNAIVKKVDETPLSEDQLLIIDQVERWIDEKLIKWDPNWESYLINMSSNIAAENFTSNTIIDCIKNN